MNVEGNVLSVEESPKLVACQQEREALQRDRTAIADEMARLGDFASTDPRRLRARADTLRAIGREDDANSAQGVAETASRWHALRTRLEIIDELLSEVAQRILTENRKRASLLSDEAYDAHRDLVRQAVELLDALADVFRAERALENELLAGGGTWGGRLVNLEHGVVGSPLDVNSGITHWRGELLQYLR